MAHRRSIAFPFTAVLAALMVLACVSPAPAAPESTMTIGVHVTLVSRWLDPAETEGLITPFMVLYAIHDALVKPMPGGLNTPSLAESWSVSKDGITYEFVIRKGARFHNGDPVTADDVKFTFERYRGSGNKLLKEKVKEVQVAAPNRVRFVLKEPWPDFMATYGTSATGAAWIVPKKYIEKVGEEGFKKVPIGAGPFKFVSFNPGVELVLEAFPDYWRKTPAVKRLVMRSIPDENTRAAAVKTGEVDIAYLFGGVLADELRKTPGIKIAAPLVYGIYWLDFLDQWEPKSPWHDRRVRQAASHAIDRDALNQVEMLGLGKTTGSFVPPTFEFSLPIAAPAYDPKRAKQLLAEAGYPNGFESGDLSPLPPYTALGEAVASYLQAVGIKTPRADDGARRLPRELAGEEAQGAPDRRDGRGRQCRRAARALRDPHRHLRLRRAARAGRPVLPPGEGAGSKAARGDAPSDAAVRGRSHARRAALPAGLHLGRGQARGRARGGPDRGLSLCGARRRPPPSLSEKGPSLRWRPRQPAQRTASTPRRLPSGAASQLDPSHRSSRVSPTGLANPPTGLADST